jgi:antibiotic biosynthesis monooxygenase (ABM) superfamily enzyme
MKNRLPDTARFSHADTQQGVGAISDSVSFVVRHRLRAGAQTAYEIWLMENMRVAAAFPGYRGIKVVRPSADGIDYTIVLDFATHEDATRWHQSSERARLIEDVQPHLDVAPQVSVGAGIDYWFPPEFPAAGLPPLKPPVWKQWLITTSVIWPLTMVVPWAFEPLFKAVPALGVYGVKQGILASVLVALAAWVIMPRYTRLLHGWLFASSGHPESGSNKGEDV